QAELISLEQQFTLRLAKSRRVCLPSNQHRALGPVNDQQAELISLEQQFTLRLAKSRRVCLPSNQHRALG
ncbi:hypothetical protein VS883_28845, partial [Escherichia coli]